MGRASYTRDERLRVCVLANEGFSQREVAERVFGDRRFHGRFSSSTDAHSSGCAS